MTIQKALRPRDDTDLRKEERWLAGIEDYISALIRGFENYIKTLKRAKKSQWLHWQQKNQKNNSN